MRLQPRGRTRSGSGAQARRAKCRRPKRVLVVGAGPAGLEYARVAAARGNQVVVYEREQQVGGHVRAYGALPNRQQYGTIATWLAEQATGNGAIIKTDSPVTAENIDARARSRAPRSHRRRFRRALSPRRLSRTDRQAAARAGKRGHCVTWDEVALDKVKVSGDVLVVDEMADVAAPLTAVKLAKLGARVRLLTKWPMIGMGNDGGSLSSLDPDISLRGRSRDDHRSRREKDQRRRRSKSSTSTSRRGLARSPPTRS